MDYQATTPVDPRVFEAMRPYFSEVFGNAASRTHVFGWEAEAAVEEARHQIAAALGAEDKEMVFTSGATESDNLAVFGVARLLREKGRHIVTAQTEHHAVLDACRALEREGFEVTRLAPDGTGAIAPDQVRAALRDETILVTLMLANNEIGTIHPIPEIGAVCRERGVLFHTDAVQGSRRSRSTSRRGPSTSPRSPRTSSTGPRARVLSTCGGATRACGSRPFSTEAATSAGCAREL